MNTRKKHNGQIRLTPEQLELKHKIISLVNSVRACIELPPGSPEAIKQQNSHENLTIAIGMCLQAGLVVTPPTKSKSRTLNFLPLDHIDNGYYFAVKSNVEELGQAAVEIVKVNHNNKGREVTCFGGEMGHPLVTYRFVEQVQML